MEYLKYSIFNNLKYKFLIVILIVWCSCSAFINLSLIKSIDYAKVKIGKLNKQTDSCKIVHRIENSDIINNLKQIEGINILNFQNTSSKNKIIVTIEANGNEKNLINVINKIENINGFYNLDNIKISNYNDKKFTTLFYVSFIKYIKE
jgi:nitrate reductase NapAB chaperone NapD